MAPLFISDLHLHEARPEVTTAFFDFLRTDALQADTLYILGDLFDAWVGDDATTEHDRRVMDELRRYTAAGHRCRFIHGNRDFLIGAGFSRETGVELLPGSQLIEIDGEPALIMHGDELCTDDRDYQRLRRIVRNPLLQWVFRRLPAAKRMEIAARLRAGSTASQQQKAAAIMDVNASAVERTMRRQDVRLLIHGHTHRPGIHDFRLDGAPARRIVLGDWYEQGSVLHWTDGGPELETLSYA